MVTADKAAAAKPDYAIYVVDECQPNFDAPSAADHRHAQLERTMVLLGTKARV